MTLRSTDTLATLLTGIGAAVGGTAYALAAGSASPAVQLAAAIPSSALASRCDDGSWIGPDGVNVNGPPDRLDRGGDGAAYIWHGADGWRLRTTDVQNVRSELTEAPGETMMVPV